MRWQIVGVIAHSTRALSKVCALSVTHNTTAYSLTSYRPTMSKEDFQRKVHSYTTTAMCRIIARPVHCDLVIPIENILG